MLDELRLVVLSAVANLVDNCNEIGLKSIPFLVNFLSNIRVAYKNDSCSIV